MRVFALKTDWMLDEGGEYYAEWIENSEDKVRVFYHDIDRQSRSCIRTMGLDVLDVGNLSANTIHGTSPPKEI